MSFNIIEAIKTQLGGDTLGQLSSLIGENQDKTKSALGASVPALLASLTSLASKPEGASQLLSTLGKLDPSLLGNFSSLLSSQGNAVAKQGNSLLASLLGSGMIGSLVGALAKFTGLGQGSTSNIISTLTPLVLGLLNKQSQTQGLNAEGIASLLAGQKQNILAAMPAGLGSVLSSVSGLSGLFGSAREAIGTNADTAKAGMTDVARSAPQPVSADRSGLPRWVIPLVILVILAFLAYQFLSRKGTENPAQAPTATATDVASQVGSGLTTAVSNVTEALTGVHDAASANAALPKLRDVSSQLDTLKGLWAQVLKGLWAQVPDAAKPAIKTALSSAVPKAEDLLGKVSALPGVGEIIRPVAEEVLNKLKGFLA
jgi:hypothetical protein